ncbi:MAG: 3-mercaptopyruvate sulfurtransferase [Pseudomonadota bacterium]
MPNLRGRYIVETDWLAERLDAPDLVVVDGSLHLPTAGRNPRAEYEAAHIPGAIFFDVDAIADKENPLPHMLPSTIQFASMMKKLGIGDGMRVIAYDSEGIYSAARVWWMFRAMGHEDVAVLNGGLKKWRADGRLVTDMPTPPRQARHFTPQFNATLVRDFDDVKAALANKTEQLADARSAGRFAGTDPEPRAGLRSGHMPGAANVPFASLLNADGTLKAESDLRAHFEGAGIDLRKPIATTCGTGVTAGVLALALAVLGRTDVGVYDGSWTEWGHEASGGDVVKGGS